MDKFCYAKQPRRDLIHVCMSVHVCVKDIYFRRCQYCKYLEGIHSEEFLKSELRIGSKTDSLTVLFYDRIDG